VFTQLGFIELLFKVSNNICTQIWLPRASDWLIYCRWAHIIVLADALLNSLKLTRSGQIAFRSFAIIQKAQNHNLVHELT
jgi:hypothetical protein